MHAQSKAKRIERGRSSRMSSKASRRRRWRPIRTATCCSISVTFIVDSGGILFSSSGVDSVPTRQAGAECARKGHAAMSAVCAWTCRSPSRSRQISSTTGSDGSMSTKRSASTLSKLWTLSKLSKFSKASSSRSSRRVSGAARLTSSMSRWTRTSATGPPSEADQQIAAALAKMKAEWGGVKQKSRGIGSLLSGADPKAVGVKFPTQHIRVTPRRLAFLPKAKYPARFSLVAEERFSPAIIAARALIYTTPHRCVRVNHRLFISDERFRPIPDL